MTPYLLIDFGTSNTKSAVCDLDTGRLSALTAHPSLPAAAGRPGHHEVPLEAIRERFVAICSGCRRDVGAPVAGIVLCSEMHGCAILDEHDVPLTGFIGWKDGRCLEAIDGTTTYDLVSGRLGASFQAITGMPPRPGFALLNLVHLGRCGQLPARGRVVSLPGWLARVSGDACGQDHPSLLASLALYDIRGGTASAEIAALVRELTGFTPLLDRPAREGQVAGYWHDGDARVPIHVGVGDHQCSVLGAGLIAADAVSINLGTGSQVAVLDSQVDDPTVETRPYFDGHWLQAVTGVPAGRALTEFVGFLGEAAGDAADFWDMLAGFDLAQIERSDLDIDLSIFPGARGYGPGGAIRGIREGRLTVDNYLASLLRCFAAQYRQPAEILDPQRRRRRCLLGGGIARRLPVLRELIAHSTGYQTMPAAAVEESMLGLRALALVAAGRAESCAAARQRFEA